MHNQTIFLRESRDLLQITIIHHHISFSPVASTSSWEILTKYCCSGIRCCSWWWIIRSCITDFLLVFYFLQNFLNPRLNVLNEKKNEEKKHPLTKYQSIIVHIFCLLSRAHLGENLQLSHQSKRRTGATYTRLYVFHVYINCSRVNWCADLLIICDWLGSYLDPSCSTSHQFCSWHHQHGKFGIIIYKVGGCTVHCKLQVHLTGFAHGGRLDEVCNICWGIHHLYLSIHQPGLPGCAVVYLFTYWFSTTSDLWFFLIRNEPIIESIMDKTLIMP